MSECTKSCDKITKSDHHYKLNQENIISEKKNTSASQFLSDLRFINKNNFEKQNVYTYLIGRTYDLKSFDAFIRFNDDRYARNRLFKNDDFEIILMCWKPGQSTLVHNHEGHLCFVSVLLGQIDVRNYSWSACNRDSREVALIEDKQHIEAMVGNMSYIDEGDGIHKMCNPIHKNESAVTLHIYSKPLTECVVYNLESKKCETFTLQPTFDFSHANTQY